VPRGDPHRWTARFTTPDGGSLEQQFDDPDDPGDLVDLLSEHLPDADLDLIPPRAPRPTEPDVEASGGDQPTDPSGSDARAPAA
jgi:hypothetical protein